MRMWVAEEAGVKMEYPLKILVDNKARVHFWNEMNPDSKLKGIFDMRAGWLKELHDTKKILAVQIATEENLADGCIGVRAIPPISAKTFFATSKAASHPRPLTYITKQYKSTS